MLRASDFLSNARLLLIMTCVLFPVGATGTAATLYDRYVMPLGLPGEVRALWWLWPLLLGLSAVTVSHCVRSFKRGASLARIETAGVAAWARVQSVKSANWQQGSSRGMVYILTLVVQAPDGSTYTATAEDMLPPGIGDALYTSWLPVRIDPRNASKAAVVWRELNRAGGTGAR